MDEKEFPTSLDTMEDYQKASVSFILPFIQECAIRIADALQELYELVDSGKTLEREDVDFFLNRFREAASFADKDNPVNHYFRHAMELEARLEEAGEFDTEESS